MSEVYFRPDAKLHWPSCEGETAFRWMVNRIDSIDKIVRRLPKPRRTCIQAGGYVGMWPMALQKYFAGNTFTFEPVPILFEALRKNCLPLPKVLAFQLALGDGERNAQLGFRTGGRACFEAQDATEIFEVKVITIDSLAIENVDLIYLDVERSELPALRGAAETIARYRPAIALEILPGQEREYGDFMKGLGYSQKFFTHRDVLFTADAA